MINGVDISEFNDNLTPLEIKNAGRTFAILRSSGTFRGKSRTTAGSMYTDTYFEKNNTQLILVHFFTFY